MSAHWVLVANASQARIFSLQPGKHLSAVQTLRHEESRDTKRLNAQEGNGQASEGGIAKARERPRFVGILVDELQRGVQHQAVEAITLVAPPAMLGELRTACKGPLAAKLDQTIAKDLVHHDTRDIQQALFA